MGNSTHQSSDIALVFEKSQTNNIQSLATAVFAVTGVTERGPIGVATLVTSPEEFDARYGGPTADGTVYLAALMYFLNGGKQLWVCRMVHMTGTGGTRANTGAKATANVPTNATQATYGTVTSDESYPFTLASGDTLITSVNGGGPATATFTGVAASVTGTQDGGFDLSGSLTLVVSFDGGADQTVTFASDATTTAEEVAAQVNDQVVGGRASVADSTKVKLTSDTKGTGSSVEVVSGTALTALGFTAGTTSGTGNVADITSVSGLEFKTIVEAAVSGSSVTVNSDGTVSVSTATLGAAGSIQASTSNVATKLGIDTDLHSGVATGTANTLSVTAKTEGSYGNAITAVVSAASSGEADRFNVAFYQSGVYVDGYANLTMDSTDSLYVETVVNDADSGSDYVVLADLDASGDATATRPANGTYGPLTGGSDGLTSLADGDFVGDGAAEDGLYSFGAITDITIVAIPNRGSATVANALVQYVEVERDGTCFAIIDTPSGLSYTSVVTWVESTASLIGSTQRAAVYWPWLLVPNKWTDVFGNGKTVSVSPSGAVAGLYARIDASSPGGVHVTPAGIDNGALYGVIGFEGAESSIHDVEDKRKRGVIYPKRINPIRRQKGTSIYVDGSKTLDQNGDWPFVAQMRGVMSIGKNVSISLDWVRHKNNTSDLRRRVERVVDSYMATEMANDAFATKDKATAYYVDVSDALNPPSLERQGKMKIRIGIAKATPAEFVDIYITKDTRALDAEMTGATA